MIKERRRSKRELELFSDPAARVIWPAICVLEEGLQHEILTELQRRLARSELRDGPQATRRAEAIRALREAADLADEGLTMGCFRQLRAEHPECVWPDDRCIRRWLGTPTWNQALAEARLPAVADGSVLIVEQGPALTRDELIAAVREASEELGRDSDGAVPSLTTYLTWAGRPDVQARPGRRPRSRNPFDRLFPGDGYRGALAAAGLIDGDSGTGLPRSSMVRAASGYRFSDERLHAALVEVAKRCGSYPHGPRVAQFMATRQLILDEEQAAGKPLRAIAGYQSIHRAYPQGWDAALIAAGLEPLGGVRTASQARRAPRGRTRRLTDAKITADLRRGYQAVGEPFTADAYEQWRGEKLDAAFARGKPIQIASCQTARARFGSWGKVVETARGDAGDAEQS